MKKDRVVDRVPRPPRAGTAVAGCLATAIALGSTAAPHRLLAPFLWENRVLIAFASGEQDGGLEATRDLARRYADGFENRDLVLATVSGSSGRLGERALTAAECAGLRELFSVGEDEFAALLIGKDGGVKLRLDRPPERDDLFPLIDSMPMRIEEMRSGR
jgi:hypothetical protein